MTTSTWLAIPSLILSLILAAACVEAPANDPAAGCAEVVRIYKDLQGAVEVVGRAVQTSEGGVEIDYEGSGSMNLPVTGAASCAFTVGAGGALTLTDAIVDGSPLPPADIDSIRTRLGEPR